MAKFTSILLLATAAIASFSSAAPIAKEPTVNATAANPFSTSVNYSGKATWFTDSYGACNVNWDGYKEPIIALNAHQMGSASWGNPACNQKVRIHLKDDPSKSVVARIVDKCPGDQCAWGSLDLSPAAFTQLGDLDTGILNIEWNYI